MIVLKGFINRLNTYLRETGMSNSDLAKQMNCSPAHISYLLSGKRNPSNGFISNLEKLSGKNSTWWIHGENNYEGLLALNELLEMLIRNEMITNVDDIENDENIKSMLLSMIKSEVKQKLKKKHS